MKKRFHKKTQRYRFPPASYEDRITYPNVTRRASLNTAHFPCGHPGRFLVPPKDVIDVGHSGLACLIPDRDSRAPSKSLRIAFPPFLSEGSPPDGDYF